jgi:hypothetical protein
MTLAQDSVRFGCIRFRRFFFHAPILSLQIPFLGACFFGFACRKRNGGKGKKNELELESNGLEAESENRKAKPTKPPPHSGFYWARVHFLTLPFAASLAHCMIPTFSHAGE